MSGLTDVEKRYLEKILNMGGGYVLDYSDATFEEFFYRYKVNIHSDRYQTYGTSKAKKMRAFWEREPDALVARVLSEMLDSYEADCDLSGRERDASLLEKSRAIVDKISGKPPIAKAASVKNFLHKEFDIPNIQRLPVEFPVAKIIEDRLNEARAALSAGAYLSVIILNYPMRQCFGSRSPWRGSEGASKIQSVAGKPQKPWWQSEVFPRLVAGSVHRRRMRN